MEYLVIEILMSVKIHKYDLESLKTYKAKD